MSHAYLQYQFKAIPRDPASDILLAQLSEFPFESFEETDEGLNAYIRKEDWFEDILSGIAILADPAFTIEHEVTEIPPENWNEQWETHFNPIEVGTICRVRAPFHEKKAVTYDIVIEPKMSFGTGHHETTHMMLEEMLSMEMKGKSVLDMGCGTAILAILAGMQGASSVVGIDIDHWSYLNALENAERNDQGHITIIEGDVSAIPDTTFDIILANINRNCLLADIPEYVRHLADGGTLLLSGFYETDEPLLTSACEEKGLKRIGKRQRNSWVAVSYKKDKSHGSFRR